MDQVAIAKIARELQELASAGRPIEPAAVERLAQLLQLAATAAPGAPVAEYRVVVDGPPQPPMPRFVEVNDAAGRSIRAGQWRARPDGFWELRLPAPDRATPT